MVEESLFSSRDCDLCENDWLLGAPGICNFSSASCECPVGFSAFDDWFSGPACTVNERVSDIILLVSFGVGLFTTLIGLVGACIIYRRPLFTIPTKTDEEEADRQRRVTHASKRSSRMFARKNSASGGNVMSSSRNIRKHQQPAHDFDEGYFEEEAADIFGSLNPFRLCCPNCCSAGPHISDQTSEVGTATVPNGSDAGTMGPTTPRQHHHHINDEQDDSFNFVCCASLRQPRLTSKLKRMGITGHKLERKWFIKRDSFIYCLLISFFGLTSVVYQSPNLRVYTSNGDQVRTSLLGDQSIIFAIALALSVSFVLAGGYVVLLTWYNSLPPVDLYGALLSMNNFIVRRPKIIYSVARWNIYFAIVYPIVLLVIIPKVTDVSPEIVFYVFCGMTLLYYLFLAIVQLFVIAMVKNIFTKTLASYRRDLEESEHRAADDKGNVLLRRKAKIAKGQYKKVEKAILTSKLVQRAFTYSSLVTVGQFVVLLGLQLRFQYIVFNVFLLQMYAVSLVVVAFMVNRSGDDEAAKTQKPLSSDDEEPSSTPRGRGFSNRLGLGRKRRGSAESEDESLERGSSNFEHRNQLLRGTSHMTSFVEKPVDG